MTGKHWLTLATLALRDGESPAMLYARTCPARGKEPIASADGSQADVQNHSSLVLIHKQSGPHATAGLSQVGQHIRIRPAGVACNG